MKPNPGPLLSPSIGASPPDIPAPAELEFFYREYFLPLVRRAVRRHGLSVQDADDIVQDAFILAISKLDGSRNPKAWLYQVVDHLCANFSRKAIRRARLMAQWNSPTGLENRRKLSSENSSDDF